MDERLGRFDAAWFTEVLRDGGHCEAAVTAAVAEPLAFAGAVAEMARYRLSYDASGRPGPATLVGKIRGSDGIRLGMDQAMGLYDREAHFYARFSDRVPVRTPRLYHVGDGTTTPLLLEDLGGLRAGDQMRGLAGADAERLMDVLGDLHAQYWGSPALAESWIVRPAEGLFAGMVSQLVQSGVETLRERFRGRVPERVLAAATEAAPRWGEVLRLCAEGPQTLVHNDCRLDNVFFADDGTPVLIDWQIPACTRGTQDVANLLAGSMTVEDLEEHWRPLLRRYHDRLCWRGVDGYGWEECVGHYRQSVLFPLGAGIALLGSMDIGDGRGLGDAIVLRTLRHAADLESFATLGAVR
jgi:hypothetical protein